jgi:diguanylate cyclase (GGDEF)-like protein/PAS domain S-box-containing protein
VGSVKPGRPNPLTTLQGRLVVLVGGLLLLFAVLDALIVPDDALPRLVLAAVVVLVGAIATYAATSRPTMRLRRLTAEAQDSATRALPALLDAASAGRLNPAEIHLPQITVDGDDEISVLAGALAAHTDAVEEMARAFVGQIAGADARFRAGFEQSPAAMAVLNHEGVIVEANDAYAALVGVPHPEVVVGHRWLDHVHEEDRETGAAALTRTGAVEPATIRYLSSTEETAHVLQTWVGIDGPDGSRHTFLQGQDVSDARRAHQTLQHLAFTDILTGLPNRAALDAHLVVAAEDVTPQSMVGMAMLDLDRFKLINDSLGHNEGDKVLRAVGKRLRSVVPEGGMVARTGGDEFSVVVSDLPDPEVMGLLAERLIAALEAPIAMGGRRFYVSASVGIAVAALPAAVEQLNAQADAAAYAAKTKGRRRWLMFDTTMAQAATERLALENDLREALGDRQLELHYQPIVDSRTRRLTGLEALVRWRHPKRGLLGPNVFIDLAEDTGLITLLGWEVLDLALSDVKRLDGVAGIDDTWRMSVNVSPAQLRHPEFVAEVARRLRVHDVPAERLMLEITESMLVEDEIIDRLQDLRRLGIYVALDDFGTGYTGVAYLSKVGVDVLKIDRAIVQAGHEQRGYAVLRAIGQLGQALGMKVVAEGVETEEDAALCLDCSCDRLQGYGISRPVPVADIATRVLPRMASLADRS